MASVSTKTVGRADKQLSGRTCTTCIYLGWADPTFSGVLGQVTRIQREKMRGWAKDDPGFKNLACQKGLKTGDEIRKTRSVSDCSGWAAFSGGIDPQFALERERDRSKLVKIAAGIVVAVLALAVVLFLFMR